MYDISVYARCLSDVTWRILQVTTFTNFDAIELASQLEKHELLEMRRVACQLYKTNKRYSQVRADGRDTLVDSTFVDSRDTFFDFRDTFLDFRDTFIHRI